VIDGDGSRTQDYVYVATPRGPRDGDGERSRRESINIVSGVDTSQAR